MTEQIADIYYQPRDYDNINDFVHDIPFYTKQIGSKEKSVLELGCGTGRIAIPLAKEGYNIAGIDYSQEMLDLAKQKAKKENLTIDFVKADIRDFSLEKKFDVIICAHNTFNHIQDLQSVEDFFACVKKHLKKEGEFILQVFMPELDTFCQDPTERHPYLKYKEKETGKLVEIMESSFYDEETQIHYIKWFTKKEGEAETVEQMNVRIYFPAELDNLVQLMGFDIINKYGDFEETPFEEYQDTQLLVCKLK